MKLAVSIEGHEEEWTLEGGDALQRWLEECPWLTRGGVRAVRVRSEEARDRVRELIWRQVLTAASDRGYVDRCDLYAVGEGGLEPALAEGLSLGATLRGVERLRRIAEELSYRPTVVMVGPEPAGRGAVVRQQAEALLERLLAQPTPTAAVFLVLVTPEDAAGMESTDLTAAIPPFADSVSREGSVRERWQRYLHLRAAWECGGDYLRAERWDESGWLSVIPEDDAGLEQKLNRAALQQWRELPAPLQAEAVGWVDQGTRPRRDTSERIERAGNGWIPPGERWVRLVPWVARALMLQELRPKARSMLRANLVCAPLARSLLGRCFDLEARLRWLAAAGAGGASADAELHQQRFARGDLSSASRFYPPNTPAQPGSALDFESIGSLVHHLYCQGTVPQDLKGLAALRNALAHGHYVSWASVQTLTELERLVP